MCLIALFSDWDLKKSSTGIFQGEVQCCLFFQAFYLKVYKVYIIFVGKLLTERVLSYMYVCPTLGRVGPQ